jgi:sialate O-acetylesterase
MSCDFIDGPTTTLVHSWTSVSPDTVKQLSGVCYIAIRDVKLVVGRPVGIITAYIGGTPVEAYANDSHLESKTCKMRIGRKGSNTPCLWLEDPLNANVTGGASIGTACPQGLFNMLIAPLVKWNLRAALWYQGEANSDEGYHRNAAEYECEFKALITTWRAAWGYSLPFFFVPSIRHSSACHSWERLWRRCICHHKHSIWSGSRTESTRYWDGCCIRLLLTESTQ